MNGAKNELFTLLPNFLPNPALVKLGAQHPRFSQGLVWLY